MQPAATEQGSETGGMRSKVTIFVISGVLIVAFCLLGWRLFYLQYSRADYYRDLSYRARHARVIETAQRGRMYDSSGPGGRLLAASNRILTVFMDPGLLADWDEKMEVAGILQPILGMSAPEICDIVEPRRNTRFVKLKAGITEQQHAAIKEAISRKENRLRGVAIQSSWERYYPMGRLTSTIIGVEGGNADENGPQKIGLTGLEQRYESLLRGTEGENILVVDKLRAPVGRDPSSTIAAKDGSSLVLTIDTTIQEFARSELLEQYKHYRAESAVAIVMDPWTGAILAMVSIPDYDPDKLSSTDPSALRNRALTDPYEPGSIFKPIVVAAALDQGIITRDELIYCEDGHWDQYRIGEWAGHRFGNLTVKEILAESSNIGMAKIGMKMGDRRLCEAVKMFGLGSKTQIDLPLEEAGQIWPLPWDKMCLTRVPYGHQINVTAIQMARAFCILANGGRCVWPHLVRAVIEPDGKVTELNRKTNLAGQVIKRDVAEWIVREALTSVVNDGTGKEAAIEGYQVFGKTGTANIAGKGGYDEINYTSSFIGGAPADNPAVIVLVSIRRPDKSVDGKYSGGRVAAPVFKRILEKTMKYLETNGT